jgi:hypothetical protein
VRTESISTRHSREYISLFIWTQLAVDLVNMRREFVRGGQKVHLRGSRTNILIFLYLDTASR